MDSEDRVVKHLEITQGVINRLANNSSLIKGWSMTILAAAMLFLARTDSSISSYLAFAFMVPVCGFWVLDGYFLWQERLFRGIYNDVRQQKDTDFKMDVPKQLAKPGNQWRNATFSLTLNMFYVTELIFLCSVAAILHCNA
uniref:Uncharacterized protein n=1 Tax=Candidatus Kentrum sp. TC TaxID=2126339 RepID=A0A450ZDF6_9GAMM|nr:MAG: hypothetical protein BECKTC1821D_GA0114238_11408 [Candidatus Kentron sp. TC]